MDSKPYASHSWVYFTRFNHSRFVFHCYFWQNHRILVKAILGKVFSEEEGDMWSLFWRMCMLQLLSIGLSNFWKENIKGIISDITRNDGDQEQFLELRGHRLAAAQRQTLATDFRPRPEESFPQSNFLDPQGYPAGPWGDQKVIIYKKFYLKWNQRHSSHQSWYSQNI